LREKILKLKKIKGRGVKAVHTVNMCLIVLCLIHFSFGRVIRSLYFILQINYFRAPGPYKSSFSLSVLLFRSGGVAKKWGKSRERHKIQNKAAVAEVTEGRCY